MSRNTKFEAYPNVVERPLHRDLVVGYVSGMASALTILHWDTIVTWYWAVITPMLIYFNAATDVWSSTGPPL